MKRYTCVCALLLALALVADLVAIAPKPATRPAPPSHPPTPLPSAAASRPVPRPAPVPAAAARPHVAPQARPNPRPAPDPVAHAAPSPRAHPTPPARPAPSLAPRPNPGVATRPAPTPHSGVAVRPAPTPRPQVRPGPRPSPSLVARPTPHPNPGVVHQPGIPGGQHSPIANLPAVNNRATTSRDITNRRTNIASTNVRQNSVSQFNSNRSVRSNQTNIVNQRGGGFGGWRRDGGWNDPYRRLHEGWYQGGGNYARYWPAAWIGAGATGDWLGGLGESGAYSNPYCVPADTSLVTPFLNYAQPIQVPWATSIQLPVPVPVEIPLPADNGDQPAPQPADSAPQPTGVDDQAQQEAAQQTFGQARAAFQAGDYALAQELVEQALQNVPGDPSLHEFRALTLFARQRYHDAAVTIYAVLAAGPGWNWDTLKALYPDVNTYTVQLRALEDYQLKNPTSGEASFLLAYHYLTLGSTDAAIQQLEHVVAVTPRDELSARLVKLLKQPQAADDRPRPQQ